MALFSPLNEKRAEIWNQKLTSLPVELKYFNSNFLAKLPPLASKYDIASQVFILKLPCKSIDLLTSVMTSLASDMTSSKMWLPYGKLPSVWTELYDHILFLSDCFYWNDSYFVNAMASRGPHVSMVFSVISKPCLRNFQILRICKNFAKL